MKKTIIISICMLLLASCSLFQKKEEMPSVSVSELSLQKEIGIVSLAQEQAILSSLTQFVLLSEDGSRIFMDSVAVKLRKYNHRRVEIEGRWNDNHNIFNVENVVSLGNETQIKQEYQNLDLGIKFFYPSVWVMTNERNITGAQKLIITPYEVESDELVTVDNIVIERSENNRRLSSKEWLNLDDMYRSTDVEDKAVYQQSTVGLARLDAVKKTNGTGDKIEFFVSRDTFIYHFIYTTVHDSDSDIAQNVFYEIIGSFEFIPIISAEIGTTTQTAQTAAVITQTASNQTEVTPRPTPLPQPPQTQQQPSTINTSADSSGNDLSAIRQSFMDYIGNHMGTLASAASQDSAGWVVTRFEFAYPQDHPENFNAIYVTYRDSNGSRKMLLQVDDRTKPESLRRIAYFEPGESTDWTLMDGLDSARTSEKAVVVVSSGASASAETIVVKSGMRLLEARSFNIQIQYPANWYWAYQSSGYSFSDRPMPSDNILLRLTKNPSTLPATMNSISSINEKQTTEGQSENDLTICVQGEDKYCLTGGIDLRSTMIQMFETLGNR